MRQTLRVVLHMSVTCRISMHSASCTCPDPQVAAAAAHATLYSISTLRIAPPELVSCQKGQGEKEEGGRVTGADRRRRRASLLRYGAWCPICLLLPAYVIKFQTLTYSHHSNLAASPSYPSFMCASRRLRPSHICYSKTRAILLPQRLTHYSPYRTPH